MFDKGLPIVFFDPLTEEMNTHLVIVHLSITKERIAGYKKAIDESLIKYCNHVGINADETEKAWKNFSI
jgi:hypothetical protein